MLISVCNCQLLEAAKSKRDQLIVHSFHYVVVVVDPFDSQNKRKWFLNKGTGKKVVFALF